MPLPPGPGWVEDASSTKSSVKDAKFLPWAIAQHHRSFVGHQPQPGPQLKGLGMVTRKTQNLNQGLFNQNLKTGFELQNKV
jgi:hypothetical protein